MQFGFKASLLSPALYAASLMVTIARGQGEQARQASGIAIVGVGVLMVVLFATAALTHYFFKIGREQRGRG